MSWIIISIISGIFAIIILSVNQKYWERKWNMNYKFERYKQSQITRRNRDKIQGVPSTPSPRNPIGNVGSLLNIVSRLNPEQIEAFRDFIGGESEEPGAAGIEDLIGRYVAENPDVVKGFLEGLTGTKKGESPPVREGY
jgi:hypothetical protein